MGDLIKINKYKEKSNIINNISITPDRLDLLTDYIIDQIALNEYILRQYLEEGEKGENVDYIKYQVEYLKYIIGLRKDLPICQC